MTQSISPHEKHVAVAIPIHKNGQILLHHRDDFDWIPYPNTWGYFGGAVEAGETPEEAMIREVKEEIDFDVSSYQHFVSHKIPECTTHVYLIYIDKDIEELTLSEGQGFAYFDFEDCFKQNLSAPSRLAFDILQLYKELRALGNLPLIVSEFVQKILPAAGAFPINSEGEILLQHRDDKPDISSPNLWATFGGRSEAGETVEVAMLRELEEELEFQPKHYLPFLSLYNENQYLHLFLADIDLPLDKLVQHEGQGMGFFSVDKAFDLDLAIVTRMCLEAFKLYKSYCKTYNLTML